MGAGRIGADIVVLTSGARRPADLDAEVAGRDGIALDDGPGRVAREPDPEVAVARGGVAGRR